MRRLVECGMVGKAPGGRDDMKRTGRTWCAATNSCIVLATNTNQVTRAMGAPIPRANKAFVLLTLSMLHDECVF